MGAFSFLDDLVEGAKTIANTVINVAGDVNPVLRVVGSAAKELLQLDKSIPDSVVAQMIAVQDQESISDQLARFSRRIAYTGKRLLEEARSLTGLSAESDGRVAVEDHLVGLWRNPVSLKQNSRPTEKVYNDVSVLVASLNIPPLYKTTSGQLRDIVEEIARFIFQDTEPKQGEKVVVKKQKTIETKNGSVISIGHVYYSITTGKAGEEYVIHSATNITYKASNDDRIAFAKAQELSTFHNTLEAKDSWYITLGIRWVTAPTAINAQEEFLRDFKRRFPHLNLAASHVQGVHQTVKIQAPPNQTPEGVRAAVQSAAQSNTEIPPEGNNDRIPLSAQNVLEVRIYNSSWLNKNPNSSPHSGWVDCIAEHQLPY